MDLLIQSWNFRDYSFDYCCRVTARAGWDGLELNYVHVDVKNLADSFPPASATAARYGLPIRVVDTSIDVAELTANDGEMERLTSTARYLAEKGVHTVNCTVRAGKATLDQVLAERRAIERLRALGEVAVAVGSCFTVEVHLRTLAETASQARRLLQAVDSRGFRCCLDYGNLIRAKDAEDCIDATRILGDMIGHIHAKNLIRFQGGHRFTTLADGEIDYVRVLADLHAGGYRGALSMENGGPGAPGHPATVDVSFLRTAFDDVLSGAIESDVRGGKRE